MPAFFNQKGMLKNSSTLWLGGLPMGIRLSTCSSALRVTTPLATIVCLNNTCQWYCLPITQAGFLHIPPVDWCGVAQCPPVFPVLPALLSLAGTIRPGVSAHTFATLHTCLCTDREETQCVSHQLLPESPDPGDVWHPWLYNHSSGPGSGIHIRSTMSWPKSWILL